MSYSAEYPTEFIRAVKMLKKDANCFTCVVCCSFSFHVRQLELELTDEEKINLLVF